MCAKQVLLPLSLAALLTLLGVSMLALHRHRVRQDHHSGVREKRTSGDEFVYMNQLHRVLWTKQLAPSSQKKFQRLPEDLLDDVFIAVKTSAKFHRTRLDVILKTWFKLAEKQTWFFSDAPDPLLSARTRGHLINTRCSSSHNRSALCCKMAREIEEFLKSDKRWFCHFDDDNYVNVPALASLLSRYDPGREFYLGKTSVGEPLEVVDRSDFARARTKKVTFWFATGGAGVCLSRPLALRLAPLAAGGAFEAAGDAIRLPDDVTLGYLVEHRLRLPLTVVKQFHSHLEPLKLIPKSQLRDQVSFSYSSNKAQEENFVDVDGLTVAEDPTRFISLHCHLFPRSLKECRKIDSL